MGMSLLMGSLAILSASGTALGFGIACVADGNGGASCVLLVLTPVMLGFPLATALGILGTAERGWLRRWGDATDEDGTTGDSACEHDHQTPRRGVATHG